MSSLSEIFCKTFCLLACGMFLQMANCYTNSADDNVFPLCQTRDCVRHANHIIKNMNPNIDPCRDFYSFACGGYKRKFGENETRSVYDDTWDLLQTQIKDLLENLRPEEGSSSEKLKIVYENCMNSEYSESKAVSDAIGILSHVGIPNWPRLNESFRLSQLSRTLGELAAYGEFAFINFKPSPYSSQLVDSDQRPPALILQGNFLLSSKWVPKDVHTSVLRILNYFNISKNEAESIWKEFKDIENAGIRVQNASDGNSHNCKSTTKTTYREINCSENLSGSMKFLCDFWRSTVEVGGLDKYFSPDVLHISCSWNHFHYIDNIFSYLGEINDR